MKDSPASHNIGAWFLGPKAENAALEEEMILYILRDYFHWRRNYFPSDQMLISRRMQRSYEDQHDVMIQQIGEMLASLRRHFPFYSPRYIGHMLSDQTLPSILGYFAGMLYNPNNVTPEAAPVTVEWELEVGASILKMLGYNPPPAQGTSADDDPVEFGWSHLTSGGTVANLEALWAARNIRYFPLAVHAVLRREHMHLDIRLPGAAAPTAMEALDERQVMHIAPDEAIALLSRFVDAVRRHFDISMEEAATRSWSLLQASGLSIAHSGTLPGFAKIEPVIFVAGSAHYSITKSAEILGFGKDRVIQVAVDDHFRMDVADLEAKIRQSAEAGYFPLAVIAIAGTTEEGAVDPIHEIVALRRRLEQDEHISFWLHIDAAWGGYIRSLFVDECSASGSTDEKLAAVANFVSCTLPALDDKRVDWGKSLVGRAYLAFPASESVTIDPHKMGYSPYPAGIIAFRNDRVRHFLTQEAPYITLTTRTGETMQAQTHRPPVNVGPFILEGSKPGAAAASVWLSHRVIAPNRDGYGQIVRASLLAARELYERLLHWEQYCASHDIDTRYEFIPLTADPPDTNIVCFVIKEKTSRSLARMNTLTQWVYKRFTIEAELDEREYSYAQPYFLSRTRLNAQHYGEKALQPFFERAAINPKAYPDEGTFVLRSTVMTPYIVFASESGSGQDYLGNFMHILAQQADHAISEMDA
ncbi:MAG: hypothetical protein KJ065_21200 [Anaerolineae bacterium]|nr:hypothetical protein [Anaerolineae bacterium]